MRNTKVLFVVNALSGGGAEGSALLIFQELEARGKNVFLVAINRTTDDASDVSDSIVLLNRNWKSGPMKTIVAYIGFIKQLDRIKPDLVVAHCELPELFCAFMPRIRTKVIAVEHTSNPWAGRKPLGVITRSVLKLRRTSWVTVNRSQNQIWLGESGPILIANPVVKNKENLSTKIGEKVVFIGRLREEKRPEWAIRAAINCSVPIGVIGNGELAQSLIEENLAHTELVKFYGYIKNPWALLSQDTLVVMPSKYEGDGLVAVEALINGFPIVLADNQDLRRFDLPSNNYFNDEIELERIFQRVKVEGVSAYKTPNALSAKMETERDITTITSKWIQILNLGESSI